MKVRMPFDRSKWAELTIVAIAVVGLAIVAWQFAGAAGPPFFLGYIAASAAIGLAIYFALSRYDQPLRRRMVLFLIGSSLFGAAAFRDSTYALFQIEGLFFDLLAGVLAAAVVHYLLAKIAGPLVFGRVWCGWACWTAMLLDQLPYKRSRGRLPGRWSWLRYAHFGLSLALVAALWYGFSYRPGAGGTTALTWFLAGNLAYYLVGITPRRKPRGKDRLPEDIAFNRAFSKRRIVVEHTIGRMRRYEALSQTDRDHRNHHSARVRAVAGLVNRQLRRYLAA